MTGKFKKAIAIMLSALMLSSVIATSPIIVNGAGISNNAESSDLIQSDLPEETDNVPIEEVFETPTEEVAGSNTEEVVGAQDEDEVGAEQTTSSGFKYTVSNGEATITGYTGSATSVSIPSSVGGYTVRKIGNNAFYEKSNITSIQIPSTLYSIGYRAFENCIRLTSITIPNSVNKIEHHAFQGCTNVSSVNIGSGLNEMGEGAFSNCISLKKVTISSGAKVIGCYAFSSCTSLDSVTVPNTITKIDYNAFEECTSLKTANIPNSVRTIGSRAYYNCKNLTSLSIGSSVSSIGYRAFESCVRLTSITIPNSVNKIEHHAFQGCTNVSSVNIGSGLNEMGEGAFSNCTNLKSVDLQSGSISIGTYAFSNCTALTRINIPESVIYIGSRKLNDDNLKDEYVFRNHPSSLTIYGKSGSFAQKFANANGIKFSASVDPISISLSKTSLTINKGSSQTITATVYPANATNKTVTWSSSNMSVATVSNGKITAKEKGSTTITAKTFNGKTATCSVTVVDNTVVSPISISLNKTELTLTVGESYTLSASISPSNATPKTVTWSSSTSSVATVSNGKVTANAKGTTNITAKTSNGKTATCKITVVPKPTTVNITSLKSDENGITIKWNAVSGASAYRVYYWSSGAWKAFKDDVRGTSKLDTGVKLNRQEGYTVVALDSSGQQISQFDSTGKFTTYKVSTPSISSVKSDENGITIKWNTVSGATTYRVYYKSGDSWKAFKDDIKGTSKLDTGIKYEREEGYKVCAVNKKGDVMSENSSAKYLKYGTDISVPQITSMKSDEKGINITWGKVNGSSTYRVYYKNSNGEWASFKDDITGTTKLDTGVRYGRAETYTVRAVNKKGEVMSGYKFSGWTTTYGVATPQITSLKNTSNGIQITWKKIDGISTYRVYYKDSDGDWARFKNDIKGTTKLDTGVKVGRKETYTIRAVDNNGNVISDYNHSGWSITYR